MSRKLFGKMSSSNFRGRRLVNMVVKTEENNIKDRKETELKPCTLVETLTLEIELFCNIHDFGNLWAHPFDYNCYNHILQPSVEYDSSLKLPVAQLEEQIKTLNDYYLEDTSITLICNETISKSLMGSPAAETSPLEDQNPDRILHKAIDDGNVHILTPPAAEFDSSLNLPLAAEFEEPIDILNYSYSKDESFSFFCNEGISSSLIVTPLAVENSPITERELEIEDDNNRDQTREEVMQENVIEDDNNIDQTREEVIQESMIETDNGEEVVQENMIDSDAPKGRTKTGNPRVRNRYEESLKMRKEAKKRTKLEKFCVKRACLPSCKKKCSERFSELERLDINKVFWELSYEGQGYLIQSLVKKLAINRRIQESTLTRNNTYKYYFEKENEKIEVCKIFFLTTLGYHQKNDRRILDALKKPLSAQTDKRGKREHKEKIDRNILRDHIESFRPAIAHYRRNHAPNRRYLPSDLNATYMFNDFKEKYPEIKISYELYRQFLKKVMNISFTQLGNEECEECEGYKLHQPTCREPASCDVCSCHNIHQERYKKARKLYQQDVDLSAADPRKIFYSADLQKVIMLPRIDMFKAVIFCPRIIAFNESFVPLGPTKSPSLQPFAAVWHEATSGRKQEDIISTYKAFFVSKRDCTDIVVWTDNCSSQNKNWAFFTFLVQIVNGSEICAETISIKYLEPGHTFMSADSFHHQVENQLQKAGKVYDFSDFIDCVQLANSGKVTVKAMEVSDFSKYMDHSSQHRLKKSTNRIYLKDIVNVEVHRNKRNLFVKTEYDGMMHEIEFLKVKYLKSMSIPDPIKNIVPRGITETRKAAILSTLHKIIPHNRLLFWQNLHINDSSTDLVNSLELEDCDET